MKKKTAVIFLGIILSCISCSKPKGFKYLGFQNAKVVEWGLKESTVGFEVGLYNPNNYRLRIKNASVDVFLNEKLLGHSKLDSLILVPKNDTFFVPLTMKVQTSRAVGGLISSAEDTALVVRLEGNARLGKGGIFFNYPIHYKGTPKLSQLIR